MIRSSLLLTALLLVAVCRSQPTTPASLTHEFIEQGEVPGLFIAVVKEDSVLYQGSFGMADKVRGTPVSAETCMELGSVGKSFTAELIYDLQHRGLLHLNDPVNKYLPGAPPAWSGITIAHLLRHTSGIQNYLQDPRFRAGDYFTGSKDTAAERFFRTVTTDSLMRLFYTLPLEFAPGAGWSYSNTGYYLLGKIAERVTGREAFDLVRDRVTAPLNMMQTQANERAAQHGCRAEGYLKKQDSLYPSAVLTSNYAFTAGAWATTGTDMVEYLKAIHRRTLPSDRAGYGWRNIALNNELPFTYEGGRFYSTYHGRRIIAHNGGTPGFSSSWLYLPETSISIVVLINRQDYAPIDVLAWDVLSLYEQALQYPGKRVGGRDAEKYGRLVAQVLRSAETGTPYPQELSAPLKHFLESEGGKGLWKWYFERGFPDKIYCVDKEKAGSSTLYRFRLPLYEGVEYRLTAAVNARGELVQLRWW